MPLYSTILCAIDFSRHSRVALRLACELAAKQGGARLIAAHTIDLLLVEAAAAAYDSKKLKADAESDLRAFVDAECKAAGVQPAEILIEIGRPEGTILSCAKARNADLIVMGTQGLGGFRKLFFGSVTEKVLRDTDRPVLAVPGGESESAAPSGPLTGVLAPVDLEQTTTAIVAHAGALAQALQLPLTLLHVVLPVQVSPQFAGVVQQALDGRRNHAETRLAQLAADVPGGVTVRQVVLIGPPPEEISAYATQHPGQIVVIGLGGRGIFHRPGSTAYRVLSLSASPVLALPERGGGSD